MKRRKCIPDERRRERKREQGGRSNGGREKLRRKEEGDIPEETNQTLSNSPKYIHPPSPPYLGRNDQ
jgi:hypothetical protein